MRGSVTAALALIAALGGAAWSGARVDADPDPAPKPLAPIPLRVDEGRVEAVLPAAGVAHLVIVSCLNPEPGQEPIHIAADPAPATELRPPALADDGPARPARATTRPAPARIPSGPKPAPAAQRTFHVLTDLDAPGSPASYKEVTARLRGYAGDVAIYVDGRDLADVADAVISELIDTFGRKVRPAGGRSIGQPADVDGDGRFCLLLSSELGRLGGGSCPLDGCVRGADFDRDVPPPYGNRADLLYLNATLQPGPHLRTILAHEYAHAAAHHARPPAPDGRPIEEEAWLDEGLAHLFEDLSGFSRSNLDYRVSAFLSRPERYRLIVPDYRADGLFRAHGNRGATYLFLRWCMDRHGTGLLTALATGSEAGIANLESATGESFVSLFRGWTVALATTGLDPARPEGRGYRDFDPRGRFGDWALAGPRTTRLIPGHSLAWTPEPTSARYVVVEPDDHEAIRLTVTASPSAGLQVTAIPLPRDYGSLDLEVSPVIGSTKGAPQVRIGLDVRGSLPIRWTGLCWEPLVPEVDPRAAHFRRDEHALAGRLVLPGDRATGPELTLPTGDRPILFKAMGIDASGRRVAAFAEWEPAGLSSPSNGPDAARRAAARAVEAGVGGIQR